VDIRWWREEALQTTSQTQGMGLKRGLSRSQLLQSGDFTN